MQLENGKGSKEVYKEMGNPIGRPTEYDIPKMIEIIKEYTENTDIPILKEVCYKNHWHYGTVRNLELKNQDLNDTIKELLDKKEVALESGALNGTLNKTMAVFSLKQLGWKDRQDVVLSGDDENKKLMKEYMENIINGKEEE